MSCEGKSSMKRKKEKASCLLRNKIEKPKHPYIYVDCECKQTTKPNKSKEVTSARDRGITYRSDGKIISPKK